MLVIEENMLRLAKMQETLLKVSTVNRKENLEKYIKTVTEIDAKAYDDILEKIKHIDEHNQSLEEEVKYLKEIKILYDQLIELQTNFRDNCKNYGNTQIQLSDLSSLDIDYINGRINAIEKYLENLKNIELNKEMIQKLSEQLIGEEKKKLSLDEKLEELEQSLKDSFGSIEGRTIIDGKLEYTNVSLEYEKINFDLERLLRDEDFLRSSIAYVRNEKREVSEKVKVAEVCYSSMPNNESRQILDEINMEDLKIKYKLTMLEIIELLTKKTDSYDSFIEKRTAMLDLIKYRLVCMETLGMKTSVDPFSRIRIKEQLDIVKSLTDNSKVVSDMMHEISKLNSMTEEMIFQNNGYLITINDTKNIIVDKVSFNDIDITPTVSFDELLVKQTYLDNQVVRVRNVSSKFNMGIIGQKTVSVIKRVNQMMNGNSQEVKKNDEIVPELVIVPVTSKKEKQNLEIIDEPVIFVDDTLPVVIEPEMEEIVEEKEQIVAPVVEEPVLDTFEIEPIISTSTVDMFSEPVQLFETTTPFEEPTLFVDRADGEVGNKKKDVTVEPLLFDKIEFVETTGNKDNSAIIDDISDTMPDVFWVTQDDKPKKDDEPGTALSFDEQINALLSFEADSDVKVKRKVA